MVRQSLQKMYLDFPHLEIKVKNDPKRHHVEFIDWKKEDISSNEINTKPEKVPSSLFSDLVKGSDGMFNDAMGHYTRLRFVMDSELQFRYELSEIIRLCLWAIAADRTHGDAYVLLANAYSLLDLHIQTRNECYTQDGHQLFFSIGKNLH